MTAKQSLSRSGTFSNTKKRRWHSFGFVAILAVGFGLISLIFSPIVYAIGIISVIGLPFAFAAVVFPTLCLIVVIAYCVYRLWPQPTLFGVGRSFAIAIAIMLAIPQLYNFQVRSAVSRLVSMDRVLPVAPLSPDETLAVIKGSSRALKCYQTCLDLLLSRQVSGYLAAALPNGDIQPTGAEKAILHRLVHGSMCENKFAFPRNRSANESIRGTVAYDLKAAADRGICVQSTQMRLADADANTGALRVIVLRDRKSLDYPKSAYFINTLIVPWRVTVYAMSQNKDWSLIMQRTKLRYSLLKPLLAYSIRGGTLSSLSSSWWREDVNSDSIQLEDVLVQNMGASLRKD